MTTKKRPAHKTKQKAYRVNIDMNWSWDLVVITGSAADAKKIAWAKFAKKLPKKKCFIINADRS